MQSKSHLLILNKSLKHFRFLVLLALDQIEKFYSSGF